MSTAPGRYPDPAAAPEISSYFSAAPVVSGPLHQAKLPGQLPQTPGKRRRMLIGGSLVIAAAVAIVLLLPSSGSVYERTHISMPKSVDGFTQLAEVNSTVSKAFAKDVPFSGARIAAYADSSGTPAVMLAGLHVKTEPANFADALEEAKTSGATTDDEHRPLDMSGLQNAAPGPLGGLMQCGTLLSDGSSVATCFFVDEGAQGMVFVNNASTVDPALMLRLRSAIEKRS